MWFGQTTIILMAAMTSISVSLYEAALVDGANDWQMFRYITLPLIKPVMIFVLVTSLVGGMQMFDIPYLLTDGRGSPTNSILTNNILMYMKFRSNQGHIGAASAVGVMVFIMTSICRVADLLTYCGIKMRGKNKETDKGRLRHEPKDITITLTTGWIYIFLAILLIITIVPIWMLLVNATRSTTEIQNGISFLPSTHMIRKLQDPR